MVRTQVRAEMQANPSTSAVVSPPVQSSVVPSSVVQSSQTSLGPMAPARLGSLPHPLALTSVPVCSTTWSGPRVSSQLQPWQQGASSTDGVVSCMMPLSTRIESSPGVTGPSYQGLILSPEAESFPKKVVDKIRSGQFVEMWEVLADSMQGLQTAYMLGASHPRLREVSSLITWCYCFLGFMAVSSKTRDQLAYARLLVKEAQCQGGRGWIDYDWAFRQQAAADRSLKWNTLIPGLQASTILSQGTPRSGLFCSLCREVDHTRAQCALACFQPADPKPPEPAQQAQPCPPQRICHS